MKSDDNSRRDKVKIIESIQKHIVICILTNNLSDLENLIGLHSRYISELTKIIEFDLKQYIYE